MTGSPSLVRKRLPTLTIRQVGDPLFKLTVRQSWRRQFYRGLYDAVTGPIDVSDPMREFFRGWKRKAGVVTLGVVCVLAAGWMRSFLVTDIIMICLPAFPQNPFIVSTSEGLGISTMDGLDFEHGHDLKWNSCFPITWATASYMRFHFQVPTVKHWSIVLPLIILSAYLLLSKPPQSMPKQMAEPAATTGT